MTTRPVYRKQGDGSRCQWQNCGCAAYAMAVSRSTLRAKNPYPVPIRNKIALFCPGTRFEWNRDAVKALYGVSTTIRYSLPWGDFLDLVKAGRGAAVVISYDAIHGTAVDACPTFLGNHYVYVNEWQGATSTHVARALVYDPLADGRRTGIPQAPKWWSLALLKKACGAYQTSGGRLGYGLVHAGFTRDTEP